MEFQQMQVFAGSISSLLFMMGTFPMLLKALMTKDLRSYSLGTITTNNVANLIHWIYVSSLPIGPIWFLQGFYTLTSLVMLTLYLHYEKGWALTFLVKGSNKSDCPLTVNNIQRQTMPCIA